MIPTAFKLPGISALLPAGDEAHRQKLGSVQSESQQTVGILEQELSFDLPAGCQPSEGGKSLGSLASGAAAQDVGAVGSV